MKKIKPIHIFLILNGLGVLTFIVLNRITNGYFFEEDFFELTGDAIYDFFVFLNQNSTSTVAFTTGSNPPLVRFIFRFIFKCLPVSVQESHPDVHLWPEPENDLRVNAFAFVSFFLLFMIAIVYMTKLCAEKLNASNLQKIFLLCCLCFLQVLYGLSNGEILLYGLWFVQCIFALIMKVMIQRKERLVILCWELRFL